MKTAKKLFSVLLAAVLLTGVFPFGFMASAAPKYHPVRRVDITLRTDIAGQSFWDYRPEALYAVTSENAGYPLNNSVSSPLRIYGKNGNAANRLVGGKTYKIELWVQASPTYYFADDVEVYVNGERIAAENITFDTADTANDLMCVDCGNQRLTNNKSIGFFARLFNAIKAFFETR